MVVSKEKTTAVKRDACWVGRMVALMEASMVVHSVAHSAWYWAARTDVTKVAW